MWERRVGEERGLLWEEEVKEMPSAWYIADETKKKTGDFRNEIDFDCKLYEGKKWSVLGVEILGDVAVFGRENEDQHTS